MQVFVYVTDVPTVEIVKEVSHARKLSWLLNLSYFSSYFEQPADYWQQGLFRMRIVTAFVARRG